MGTDPRVFYIDSEQVYKANSKSILFVGRLSEKKGVIYLIKAFKILQEKYSGLKLDIVGSGNQKPRLKKISSKLNLENIVCFHGDLPHEELADYLRNALVFVGPSIEAKNGDQEGFGLVFVEAMLCGCPVIGTNTGGIPDIIINGETGLLIKQKNPEAIANAIEKVLKNNRLRQKLIKNGYEYARKNFTQDKIIKKYYKIYNSLR